MGRQTVRHQTKKKGGAKLMNTAKSLRILSMILVVAAAVSAGYAVYAARRTEPVVVATQTITPFTTITPQNIGTDFMVKQEPISAMEPGTLTSLQDVINHTTQLEILSGAQVQAPMISPVSTMQGLINAASTAGMDTFSLPIKSGTMEPYMMPGSYVNLATQGPNGMIMHVDHVLVLQNTGYSPNVGGSSTSTNQQNQNPMLILTLPEATYLSMFQSLANDSVQVLMIPQDQPADAPSVENSSSSGATSSVPMPSISSFASRTTTSGRKAVTARHGKQHG
jgi:hypothetical protein